MTPLPLASPVTIGDVVAGKYRVESVLGTGAMGVVVGARHIALEHSVAIKLLLHHRWGSREESIARFLTEARAAAKIDSEHVARVHDVGTLADGTPYMVMEHLDGWDLETELERRGPLPVTEAVDFVRAAADAIVAADQLGIVHRDLKPTNLFLAVRADGMRCLKVLDFGISKIPADRVRMQRPREDGSFGTPAYMSPEQVSDPASVDTRTDLWALGAILYELLTGRLAFPGSDIKATLDLVMTTDPPALRAVRPDVPSDVEAIVMRCLARDRDARFRDAAELGLALAPFGAGGSIPRLPIAGVREAMQTEPDPAELAPVHDDENAQRAIRRRRARDAGLVVASVVVLVAIGVAVTTQVARSDAPVHSANSRMQTTTASAMLVAPSSHPQAPQKP